jgi:hypothetical protein
MSLVPDWPNDFWILSDYHKMDFHISVIQLHASGIT